jgi:hypothetical protein
MGKAGNWSQITSEVNYSDFSCVLMLYLQFFILQGKGGPLLFVRSELPILDADENCRRKPTGQYFVIL